MAHSRLRGQHWRDWHIVNIGYVLNVIEDPAERLTVGLSFRRLPDADEGDATLARQLRAEMLRGQSV